MIEFKPNLSLTDDAHIPAFYLSGKADFCNRGKTLIDILFILAGLPVVIPVMLIIAFWIKYDSKGSIIFCQKRLGKDGKIFTIYKFRTMHSVSCDALGGEQAKKNDMRVTRIGKWLRRSGLDELPQLLNVVKGDMSLIGPRPHALAHDLYYSQHILLYWTRYSVKPGLTGWAQIMGSRGETPTIESMAKRVTLDRYYIKKRNFSFDIAILFKTVHALLKPPTSLH